MMMLWFFFFSPMAHENTQCRHSWWKLPTLQDFLRETDLFHLNATMNGLHRVEFSESATDLQESQDENGMDGWLALIGWFSPLACSINPRTSSSSVLFVCFSCWLGQETATVLTFPGHLRCPKKTHIDMTPHVTFAQHDGGEQRENCHMK